MTGFCTSPEMTRHLTGHGHPERPQRLGAIFQAVRGAGLVTSRNPLEPVVSDLGPLASANFKLKELEATPIDPKWIEAVHPGDYLRQIEEACAAGAILDGGDTVVCPDSFRAALLSAG